jgi:Zn-dependent protease with chaperone function
VAPALSIRTRALLAVALLVGFYLLALAVAALLLYLPYAEWRYTGHVILKLLAFAFVGAYLILRSLLPRAERFEAPGPRLARPEHPRLFALVDEVARATGQAAPADVHLVPDVNAFVAEVGGTGVGGTGLGLGGVGGSRRRILGVGLPLLEVLSVAELRAVLAHEFGHYVSGDTRLGPWIYRTRAAIARTLKSLAGHSTLLMTPFAWYGAAFLRVTHAVSRAQELVADATAARVAGRETARRALVRIEGGAGAYEAYLANEFAPVLGLGFRPPIVAGFRQFLAAPGVSTAVGALVDHRLTGEPTDPYDTHPGLRDRLAALDGLPDGAPTLAPGPGEDAPATALLADLATAEAALVASFARGRRLEPIAWEAVPATVLPIGWREMAAEGAAVLAGLTPERLPASASDCDALAVQLRPGRRPVPAMRPRGRPVPGASEGTPGGVSPDDALHDEDRMRAARIVGAALALGLLERSGARAEPGGGDAGDASTAVAPAVPRLEAGPGEPVRFFVGAAEIWPFTVLEALRDGSLTADAWRAQCEAAGIVGVDLGGVAPRRTRTAANALVSPTRGESRQPRPPNASTPRGRGLESR